MKVAWLPASLAAIACCFATVISLGAAPANVYLVVGSDTRVGSGESWNRYHCHYRFDLYSDPKRNAHIVMDPAFRNRLVDSYGTPMKMTWWMMAGNIFRFADNTDVPAPAIMSLYVMKKYHGAAIQKFGDELSLHYHPIVWRDCDGDGTNRWEQPVSFLECQDDFDFTIAQFLLEEDVFPVSFRSGWHCMDNEWQRHLDEILPFSMHCAYGAKIPPDPCTMRGFTGWYQSPTEFVPYHPSPTNYQVRGTCTGWDLRCAYMGGFSQNAMNQLFAKAQAGTDQIACLWAHLPDADFPTNMVRIDELAHVAAGKYPAVKFRYCSAIEGMQRWMKTDDHTPPKLDITEEKQGDALTVQLRVDEPIFQPRPFAAFQDIYKNTTVLSCVSAGTNAWKVAIPGPRQAIAKVGFAVTDPSGNLTTRILRYAKIPDELTNEIPEKAVIVDNTQATFQGSWATGSSSTDKYGENYRFKTRGNGSGVALFTAELPSAGRYHVFEWHAAGGNRTIAAPHLIAFDGGEKTIPVNQQVEGGTWNLLGTFPFAAGKPASVKITDAIPDSGQIVILADAVRFVLEQPPVPPTILAPPLSQTVSRGTTASFFVTAAKGNTLSYQWQFNGKDIAGATTTALTLTNVGPAKAGSYCVLVSNKAGAKATSEPAVLKLVSKLR